MFSMIDRPPATAPDSSHNGAEGSLSVQQALDDFSHLADLGFDEAIISLPNVSNPDAFDVFRDEIVPEVQKIKVAGR